MPIISMLHARYFLIRGQIITIDLDYWQEGGVMAQNRYKEVHMAMPVENNDTAAWANVTESKPVSKVSIPDEVQVRNAKEYVDTNQK